jgi:hypothetical protein
MPQPSQDHRNDAAANANTNVHAGPQPMDGQPLQQDSNESSDTSGKPGNGDNVEPSEKKRTLAQRSKTLWTKTGITWPRFKLMFKGALAPTVAIALFQADDFASHFSTVGYLVGITSILSLNIQPRSKFLQTMLVNVVFVCFAAACVTLALYTCVQARIHSGESGLPSRGGANTSGLAAQGAQTAPYNSSAAAVAGIWLMVMIYCMSTVRAAKPQFMIPAMAGAIIGNVGMVYAPQFSSRLVSFVRSLLFSGKAILLIVVGNYADLCLFAVSPFCRASAKRRSLRKAAISDMNFSTQ